MFQIIDTYVTPAGVAIPNTALWITPESGFLQLVSGVWVIGSVAPRPAVTDVTGAASLPAIPAPSVTSPNPLFWIFRDADGRFWRGTVPEGIASSNVHDLRHVYLWTETKIA